MDLSELPNDTVRSVLCETVAKCLNSNKYRIGLNLASKTGESNFIGIVYRAEFSADKETENENHPVHSLIVKIAPQDIEYRNTWYSRSCFLREIHIYNEVRIYSKRGFHSARKRVIWLGNHILLLSMIFPNHSISFSYYNPFPRLKIDVFHNIWKSMFGLNYSVIRHVHSNICSAIHYPISRNSLLLLLHQIRWARILESISAMRTYE